ncbi:hypothetical protein DET54_106212 [Paenibacillus pabuli]|uniref:Uncharacterized protein n=2 Tax=Paenibacillus TaxID=44249 RepID=A0A855Y3S9_9BACL|nr:hypothetical protein DET56_112212 [Paenibacillus pabuli]PXW02704.1 hypothetical protein DEU73_11112 [Paenibacillus taichungensis]RAI96854.1 hypothetical protein DET54_106212 [Paenibacillus pabuli]
MIYSVKCPVAVLILKLFLLKEYIMKSNKPRTLQKNIEFFTAALSQCTVTAWQEDPAGVYCEVGRGIVEQISEDSVRIRNDNGTKSHYDRDITMFQTEK